MAYSVTIDTYENCWFSTDDRKIPMSKGLLSDINAFLAEVPDLLKRVESDKVSLWLR